MAGKLPRHLWATHIKPNKAVAWNRSMLRVQDTNGNISKQCSDITVHLDFQCLLLKEWIADCTVYN